MRKRISVLLATAASVLLIFVLLFTAVQIGINDHTFINNEYTRLGLAKQMGMSNAELVNSCVHLIDYMQGDADSIDIYVTVNGEKTLMFDQAQEVEHMKDVRTLFLTCKQYRDMALLALLVLFLLAAVLTFRDALGTIAKGMFGARFSCSSSSALSAPGPRWTFQASGRRFIRRCSGTSCGCSTPPRAA